MTKSRKIQRLSKDHSPDKKESRKTVASEAKSRHGCEPQTWSLFIYRHHPLQPPAITAIPAKHLFNHPFLNFCQQSTGSSCCHGPGQLGLPKLRPHLPTVYQQMMYRYLKLSASLRQASTLSEQSSFQHQQERRFKQQMSSRRSTKRDQPTDQVKPYRIAPHGLAWSTKQVLKGGPRQDSASAIRGAPFSTGCAGKVQGSLRLSLLLAGNCFFLRLSTLLFRCFFFEVGEFDSVWELALGICV